MKLTSFIVRNFLNRISSNSQNGDISGNKIYSGWIDKTVILLCILFGEQSLEI